jgi:hypothetical protein
MTDAHYICCLIGPYSRVVVATLRDLFLTSARYNAYQDQSSAFRSVPFISAFFRLIQLLY